METDLDEIRQFFYITTLNLRFLDEKTKNYINS